MVDKFFGDPLDEPSTLVSQLCSECLVCFFIYLCVGTQSIEINYSFSLQSMNFAKQIYLPIWIVLVPVFGSRIQRSCCRFRCLETFVYLTAFDLLSVVWKVSFIIKINQYYRPPSNQIVHELITWIMFANGISSSMDVDSAEVPRLCAVSLFDSIWSSLVASEFDSYYEKVNDY